MTRTIGIVGLANSGKSTLFNALIKEKKAKTAFTPFTTISHQEGFSPGGSEESAEQMSEYKFLDIGGLVRGSHRGQGIGNAFLDKVRSADVLLHVVRAFYNNMVAHPHRTHEPGSLLQVTEDIEVVNEELRVAGVYKPVIYLLNFDQNKLTSGTINEYLAQVKHKFGKPVIAVCAKLEEELVGVEKAMAMEKLASFQMKETALEQVIKEVSLLFTGEQLN